MLWPLRRAFAAVADNLTISSVVGVTITASSTAHTKGSWTQMVSSTPFEVGLLHVLIQNTSASGANTSMMLDIGLGSSPSSPLIADLLCGYAGSRGRDWYFPLRIPAGQEIRGRIQAANPGGVADTAEVGVYMYGGEDLLAQPWVGTTCTSYGPDSSDSQGVPVTVGNQTKGSWTTIGTASSDHKYVTLAVQFAGDTNLTARNNKFFDIGVGSTPTLVASNIGHHSEGVEEIQGPFPSWYPIAWPAMNGQDLKVRAASELNADLSMDAALYGVT
jgi:hypothetical protein